MMFLLPLLARVGVPAPLRKAVAYIALAVALIACAAIAKHFYDNAVEARYEAKVQAQVTKATEAASNTANINDADRQADNARADQSTREAINHVDPVQARRPAGAAVNAAADSLRTRKSASRTAPD